MTTTTFKEAETRRPPPTSPIAGGVIAIPFTRTIDVSAEFTAANDKLRLCILPAEHVPVDLVLTVADLDSNATPTVVFEVGIEDATQDPSDTTDLDALIAAATTAQAGGLVRMGAVAGIKIAPIKYNRFVTMNCTTAPATDQDGVVAGVFFCRPALRGE